MSELNQKVHELTRNYLTAIERDTDDGPKKDYVEVLSLLSQLDIAMTAYGRGGGSGAGGSKAPVALKALDLKHEIDQVSAQYADRRLPLPARIQRWAQEAAGDEQRESECLAWLSYWSAQITGLDEETIDIQRPCPMCGVQDYHEQDEANPNNFIHRCSLVASTSQAYCRNCKTVWEGKAGLLELSSLI